MLRAIVGHNGIDGLLDSMYSVEEAGIYKAHPKTYALAGERLGLDRRAILLVSANAWDAYAASAFGMRVAWCNRYRQRPERLPGNPDCEVQSLADCLGLSAHSSGETPRYVL